MRRASASKKYRRLAREAAHAEHIEDAPWGKATVSPVFYHEQKRRRDDVNHAAMLKPAYDGVVEAGMIVDDDSEHLTSLPVTFRIGKPGRVELTFERIDKHT